MRGIAACFVSLFAGFGALLAGAAGAHDFWIQPETFWSAPGIAVPFTLQVGHGPLRQRTPIPSRRVTRFSATGPTGAPADRRGGLHLGDPAADGAVRFDTPGVYVLALETDAKAESHLPAIRYNDYLQVEGLTPALEWRARRHQAGRDGSETYSRCAKSLLAIGAVGSGADQAAVTRPVGLALEIVPELSPYALPRGTALPVHILYDGRPLPGALVKLNDLDHDAQPVEIHRTDPAGRAIFRLPAAGRWQMNVIWTRPLPATAETDFETTFSSLSFGLPALPAPAAR